ncbi:hypothetical protein [Pseudomonas sp. NPDC089734]|uniref:hypothetical protein n=1 Tax=Pseudomonas sp. NPDC089734 TaxID=3364469 RepID=UPI0037F789D2
MSSGLRCRWRGDGMRALVFLLLLGLSTFTFAGYDVHISRKAFWADEAGPRISLEEWLAYVKTDAQIVRDAANSPQDFMVSITGESFPLWYRPDMGELYTKDPSDRAMTKLEEIARRLKARVQGDDGEFYPAAP